LIEVNRRPVISVDKENEIDKRRRELAKQREAREKQIKEEVKKTDSLKFTIFCFHLGRKFRQKTARIS
jgi:hypothetical protein